jgi:3-oxoacyl-[acyl-carrier protein] reductase
MIQLDGRKALITGGSRGIGRATALMFAQAGSDVAFTYIRNDTAALEVKKGIEKLGRNCLVFKADLSFESEARRLVEKIVEQWGEFDTVVNNAGIWTYGEMGSMMTSVWEETIKVNLDSVFHVCNAVVPHLKAKKRGWIINISSTAGQRGEAFHSHYAATKGAVIALTKSLATELAPFNIRVNCVAPGWVDTDMCTEVFSIPGYRDEVRESIPLKRIPPPEDIAGPILFLASDLARHITGEILNVNGGSVLCG